MMKNLLCVGALLLAAIPASARPANHRDPGTLPRVDLPTKAAQPPSTARDLRGRVSFLERIALSPGHTARVAIYQSIGGESVPLAAGTFPCDASGAAFSLPIPANVGPLIARAWILRPDGALWHHTPAPIPVPRGANDLELLTRGAATTPAVPPAPTGGGRL